MLLQILKNSKMFWSSLWTLKLSMYLKYELMESTDFLHVDADSQKLKAHQKCIG